MRVSIRSLFGPVLLAWTSTASASSPAERLFVNPRSISVAPFATVAPAPTVPGEPAYRVPAIYGDDATFRAIRRHGGRVVRVVTNPIPLIDDTATVRRAAIAQIMAYIDRLGRAGLGAVIDIHTWPPGDPGQQAADLVSDPQTRSALIRGEVELAQALATKRPGRVGLELLNEPACRKMHGAPWLDFQAALYTAVRKVAVTLPVVVTGCDDDLDALAGGDLDRYAGDANAVFAFHFYEPFIFTHQPTYYGGIAFQNVPFPPVPAPDGAALARMLPAQASPDAMHDLATYLAGNDDAAMIAARIKLAGDWASRHRVKRSRVWMGEFGTNFAIHTPALDAVRLDQLRWLGAIRSAAQQQQLSYAFWIMPGPGNYNYDPATRFVRSDVLRAIGWFP